MKILDSMDNDTVICLGKRSKSRSQYECLPYHPRHLGTCVRAAKPSLVRFSQGMSILYLNQKLDLIAAGTWIWTLQGDVGAY